MVREATRQIPGEDGADEGRGWPFPLAQFDDRLWLRQRRWQPPLALQPADFAGWRGRWRLQARPLSESRVKTSDQPVPEHGGSNRSARRRKARRFDRAIGRSLKESGVGLRRGELYRTLRLASVLCPEIHSG